MTALTWVFQPEDKSQADPTRWGRWVEAAEVAKRGVGQTREVGSGERGGEKGGRVAPQAPQPAALALQAVHPTLQTGSQPPGV